MSTNVKIVIISCNVILLVLGYAIMKLAKIGSKKQIEAKLIKGVFSQPDIIGDKVVPIANSYHRIGIIIFVFTIIFTIIDIIILYCKW